MVVHLLTNLSAADGPAAFQRNVYSIHSLGGALPVVEWLFIFLPILFHAAFGVVIVLGGLPNTGSYPLAKNYRYTLQRVTGMIAFAFIAWHVFHMHGWIHADWWINRVAGPYGGAQFRAYNAASTAGEALRPVVVAVLYAIGVLACVYHLANGIWTMGITWGVWISPAAQRRADYVCAGFGVLLAAVGLSALVTMRSVGADPDAATEAIKVEDRMYNARVESGQIDPNPHKRRDADGHAAGFRVQLAPEP
jgi:succinate dehydrogenase / fumarate reductase cytochrome b subunit